MYFFFFFNLSGMVLQHSAGNVDPARRTIDGLLKECVHLNHFLSLNTACLSVKSGISLMSGTPCTQMKLQLFVFLPSENG